MRAGVTTLCSYLINSGEKNGTFTTKITRSIRDAAAHNVHTLFEASCPSISRTLLANTQRTDFNCGTTYYTHPTHLSSLIYRAIERTISADPADDDGG